MTQAVLEREAEAVERTKDAPKTLRVCFVCTGNTCRSPMAEAVANALAKKAGKSLEAFSAGLYAAEGEPISLHSVLALKNAEVPVVEGHDYHKHTAHTLGDEAETFDLLVGLGRNHAMELLMRFPQLASRITCMPEPIADPYGGSLAVYEESLEQITKGVKDLLFAGESI